MSAEEADKTATTDASAGDEEEEWLYGDEPEGKEEDEEAKLNAAVSAPTDASTDDTAEHPTGNGVTSETTGEAVGEGESDSDSDDDDDDVRVTIGDIKTGAPQYTPYGAPPVNLNIKTIGSRPYGQVAAKLKGVDLDAPGNINGVPVLEVEIESFEEKPWRKPGADLSDYFNYGFNEDTWKAYCEKQKRLRMGLEVSVLGSVTSKITVQQGRTGNEKDMSILPPHTSKPDFTSPINQYKASSCPSISCSVNPYRKSSGTIDVIGGQLATISRVEGRRRHNLEGNNIQVISEHNTSDAEPTPAKMPPFFPPGPIPPNIPPPPFLPPPPNVSTAPPLIPPPRMPMTVPPPGFPPPPSGPPPSIIPTMDGHSGGYDGRSVPPYSFPPGSFPPPMAGGVPPWPPMMDNSKTWDYYPRREDKRDKERERPRERTHEREREREHSPSGMGYTSEEERYRFRDYQERGYTERHRDRSSREKEERHRERRHREKEEGRHKSSRSSSRRRHESEEGDSHRRHKHKKSKRSKEGKDPGEVNADPENQEPME
ncbi:pre-mRNA 3'-end-processing factor FIP1 isoform X2 [Gouania willdenowi]|uniref:pre-mRNA 3'-end-processing factor FIP1 isoform X2 n=1 Tax=Gouania willdenowi TaxID=441366 RepID=UPI001055946B|nr:pre-mRNA 3'-end-processing factor FIP1 isoform X2 [Gouania willdenowi]